MASIAPKGSSKSVTLGSAAKARATPTRCCWPPDNSLGYDISKVIYDIEIKGYNSNNEKNIISGYNILVKNKDNKEFHSIIVRLKNTLNHDEAIDIISSNSEKTRSEIIELFDQIEMRWANERY